MRKSNEYTQERLAEEIEISTKSVSFIESDKVRPSYEVLIRICNLFGIGLDQIFQSYLNIEQKEKQGLTRCLQKIKNNRKFNYIF